MYLFTRRVIVSPSHARAGMAHAIAMTEFVNQKTNLEVSLFQTLQGEPLGTLTFAYRCESYAGSLESADKLVASDEYLSKIEEGASYFLGTPQDQLGTIAHIAGEISGPPAAASAVTATIDVPQVAKALSWSVDVANYTTNLGGVPIAVVTSDFGQFGRVSWISYGQSVAELEQSQEKINADPGYLQRLSDSEGLFLPGSGTGSLSRKIA